MWKSRLNTAVAGLTGYQLRRVQDPATTAPKPRRPSASAKATATQQKRRGMPKHWDETAQATIRQVKPRTMTSREKLFGLILATRYVAQHRIPGDVVECGVWRGGSMQAVALTLAQCGDVSRQLHLFDTFEGMPPPTAEDARANDGRTAAELLAERGRDEKIWAVATLDDVQAGMAELDYPQDRISFHPGRVEETIPDEAPSTIALLRLDTDWYASTKHELHHLYDRVSPGGVLILDDYGYWEGARKATEEFLQETGAALLLMPLDSGRIAVKPWA